MLKECLGITAKAGVRPSQVASLVQRSAELGPLGDRAGAELSGIEGPGLGSNAGRQAYRSAEDQRRRGDFAPRDSSFQSFDRPEERFKVVIGSWELKDMVGEEESGPVTASDFQEMPQSPFERTGLGATARKCAQQPLEARLDLCPVELLRVVENVGRLVDPTVSDANGRPEGSCFRQRPVENDFQASELFGRAPF